MKKTITQLNSKLLYRLTKVIYCFIFFSIFTISIIMIWSNSNISDSEVLEKFDTSREQILEEEKNIDTYTDQDKAFLTVLKTKGIEKDEAFQRLFEVKAELKAKEIIDTNKDMILLKSKITHTLLLIIVLLLAFEGIKRSFYYIVFGNFRPISS